MDVGAAARVRADGIGEPGAHAAARAATLRTPGGTGLPVVFQGETNSGTASGRPSFLRSSEFPRPQVVGVDIVGGTPGDFDRRGARQGGLAGSEPGGNSAVRDPPSAAPREKHLKHELHSGRHLSRNPVMFLAQNLRCGPFEFNCLRNGSCIEHEETRRREKKE